MSILLSPPPQEGAERPRYSWRKKFAVAFRGIKIGVRGHSSFFVHFFFTALVLVTAVALSCEPWQWCALIGCIGFVLTAELFNSTIETLFAGLDEETKSRTWPALDVAAGAVLMASMTAVVIGCIVFMTRLVSLVGQIEARP